MVFCLTGRHEPFRLLGGVYEGGTAAVCINSVEVEPQCF